MARFKKSPINAHEGKLVCCDCIIDDIVELAINEIVGVEFDFTHSVIYGNPIKVVFEKDGVHVDVSVKIHFTQSVAEMAFKIQESIRHNVESMTEFHVANVNVNIHGVYFEDELDDKSNALPDEQEEQDKQEGQH